jgi:hypothetical protein
MLDPERFDSRDHGIRGRIVVWEVERRGYDMRDALEGQAIVRVVVENCFAIVKV